MLRAAAARHRVPPLQVGAAVLWHELLIYTYLSGGSRRRDGRGRAGPGEQLQSSRSLTHLQASGNGSANATQLLRFCLTSCQHHINVRRGCLFQERGAPRPEAGEPAAGVTR